jgi:hypothetical protein
MTRDVSEDMRLLFSSAHFPASSFALSLCFSVQQQKSTRAFPYTLLCILAYSISVSPLICSFILNRLHSLQLFKQLRSTLLALVKPVTSNRHREYPQASSATLTKLIPQIMVTPKLLWDTRKRRQRIERISRLVFAAPHSSTVIALYPKQRCYCSNVVDY